MMSVTTTRKAAATVASFAIFFGIWWSVWRFSPVPPYLLPSPQEVFTTLYKALTLALPTVHIWSDAWVSLQRQLLGFGLAVGVGIPLGIACGYLQGPLLGVDRFLRIVYPIPTFAWIPMVLIWFGPGGKAITFMVAISAFWPVYMQTYQGTRQLSSRYLWVASALGATRMSVARSILLPGSLPYVLNGLRLGYGESWRLLVAAEILLATAGLGHLIQFSRSTLDVDRIMAGMAMIGILGFLVERFAFDRIERMTIGRWRQRSAE
jgi:ABC-type nitrate/sulfonate/bicarbonate transport system permease component